MRNMRIFPHLSELFPEKRSRQKATVLRFHHGDKIMDPLFKGGKKYGKQRGKKIYLQIM